MGEGDLRRRIGMGSLEEDIVEVSNRRREILRVCRPKSHQVPQKSAEVQPAGDEQNGCI